MQKVIITSSMNNTPEDEINKRVAKLGKGWRITSATTAIALQGTLDIDNPVYGKFYGVAKHAYYVTTIVVEKCER